MSAVILSCIYNKRQLLCLNRHKVHALEYCLCKTLFYFPEVDAQLQQIMRMQRSFAAKLYYILSTAVAYFCVIADNDFLNDPHNLIYSWILLIMISLYVPVP